MMNPIAIRTRDRIKDALITLMSLMTYNDITIQAIALEGEIARRTFYRHYTSKEEVLNDIIDGLFKSYTEAISDHAVAKLPDITEMFFKYWFQHKDFLKLIEKNNMAYLFLESLNEYIPIIYSSIKGELEQYDEEALKYLLSFSIGGHFNAFMLWLKNDSDIEPEMIKLYIKQGIVVNK